MTEGKRLKEMWLGYVKGAMYAAPHMCATCSRFKDGKCVRFDTPVPEKYQYEESDCKSWATLDLSPFYEDMESIPF